MKVDLTQRQVGGLVVMLAGTIGQAGNNLAAPETVGDARKQQVDLIADCADGILRAVAALREPGDAAT